MRNKYLVIRLDAPDDLEDLAAGRTVNTMTTLADADAARDAAVRACNPLSHALPGHVCAIVAYANIGTEVFKLGKVWAATGVTEPWETDPTDGEQGLPPDINGDGEYGRPA